MTRRPAPAGAVAALFALAAGVFAGAVAADTGVAAAGAGVGPGWLAAAAVPLQAAVEPSPGERTGDAAPAPPPVAVEPAVPTPPAEPSDEQVLLALLADLQRYGTLSGDDLRRETAALNQVFSRQRTDANRLRLATLYALGRNAPDDQRALQLFDAVARSNPGSLPMKQLAAVLQVQVAERVRAVRDEQQKADAAVQKLEALRAMERSLLRDRVRSGGGGGGGGGSGN